MTHEHRSPTDAVDRLTCDAELSNLPALLALVCRLCRREAIDEPTCHDLRLIVEEACVNVMHHAYPSGQSGPLTLAVHVVHRGDSRSVVMTLEDLGRSFDPLSVVAAEPTAALEVRALGGLGVHLIRHLSDRQQHQRHPHRGNILTIEKHLIPPPTR